MGASNSRLEEDKGLQLCRARKKFIKLALNGRCSVAAAHIAYIEELKILGLALSRFVEQEPQHESYAYHPSRTVTPEPRVLSENLSPHMSPSTPIPTKYETHHMKFSTPFSNKVEEKPNVPIAVSVNSTTPRSTDGPDSSSFEPEETPPWDYFGLFHPIDDHFDSGHHEGNNGISHIKEEEEIPDLEDVTEEIQESDDEFDEPSSATLVRSFENFNRSMENGGDSPILPSESVVSEIKDDLSVKSSERVVSETKFVNGKKNKSPELSPLRATSSRFVDSDDVKITPIKESEVEDKIAPKDFFSSMKDIEQLFVKASESGKEVPRMLEANKFHFRPVFPGKEGGSIASSLLSSCFSCGDDPSEVQKEPPQNSVKYLTWHRTTSSRSASSRNLLGANSIDANKIDDIGNNNNNLFDNFCMVSGSHASTLDRLYAWEKKLYDEVKAGQVLRSNFDQKCKLLRQQESRGEKTDKTRSGVKDLHSRIRVSIHRIDSISKKIEEIRDKELQPQLEELIEGLKRMWQLMFECHTLQFHVISISHSPGNTKITVQSDSRRQVTIHLENELNSLLSTFTKWIGAQKIYVDSIDKWLFKCVSLPQKNTSKRNKRMKPPSIRNWGPPPIYIICGDWLKLIEKLPSKQLVESIKDLAAEVSSFLPRQHEKKVPHADVAREEAPEEWGPGLDRFKTSLAGFLGQLNNFAESSVNMFGQLQETIKEAKSEYENFKPQQDFGKAGIGENKR